MTWLYRQDHLLAGKGRALLCIMFRVLALVALPFRSTSACNTKTLSITVLHYAALRFTALHDASDAA